MNYMLIKDSYYKHDWGIIEYNEKTKQFRIYIRKDKKFKVYPIFMQAMVYRHKRFVIEPDLSMQWVKERLIPSYRQNIDTILSSLGLSEYDEYELLKAGNGKCPQDDIYLKWLTPDETHRYANEYNIVLQS